jgi:hypothetical protein
MAKALLPGTPKRMYFENKLINVYMFCLTMLTAQLLIHLGSALRIPLGEGLTDLHLFLPVMTVMAFVTRKVYKLRLQHSQFRVDKFKAEPLDRDECDFFSYKCGRLFPQET